MILSSQLHHTMKKARSEAPGLVAHPVFVPVHLLPPITQHGIDGDFVELAHVPREGKELCRNLGMTGGFFPHMSDEAIQVVGDPVQAVYED